MIESAESVFEFRVPVDRAAYFIPTVGIVFLAAIGATVVLMFVVMTMPGGAWLHGLIPAAFRDAAAAATVVMAGVGSGAYWVRRMMRIHGERKLVIDRDGITYVAFSDRKKTMRWDDIVRVVETSDSIGECYNLRYQLRSGRFDVGNDDFCDYSLIKFITLNRLPGKTMLVTRIPAGVDKLAVARALSQWGHLKGTESLLFMSAPIASHPP